MRPQSVNGNGLNLDPLRPKRLPHPCLPAWHAREVHFNHQRLITERWMTGLYLSIFDGTKAFDSL